MSTPLRVRDATAEEREAVRQLTLSAYAEYEAIMAPPAWAGLEAAVRGALDAAAPADHIVAERDGVLVGSVLLFPAAADAYGGAARQASWPEVRLLAVPPELRGQGIGRALMDECVRRAQRSGATELGLHTSMSMRAAIHLYTQMGFARAPDYDFRPSGAELVEGYRMKLSDE